VIIANFQSPTSLGRIAGYRIRNGQSVGLESRSTKNGDAADAYDESMRSDFAGHDEIVLVQSLDLLVLNETVAQPQPNLMSG
jgi:hypothetical protein